MTSESARATNRLLKWAKTFCMADEDVQTAREMYRNLWQNHEWDNPQDHPIPCIYREDDIPREKICDLCREFLDQSPDYQDALWRRRSAKYNMKRAFRDLTRETARPEAT